MRLLVVLAAFLLWPPALSLAQTPAQETQTPSQEPERTDPDVQVDALQPDFTMGALPTTLRMPRRKWAFRVTHRFTRPLGQGDLGDLVSDAFGFDSGAQIGLELRYGLVSGTQVGVHRTSDRTVQFFGQHSFLAERNGAPIGLDALATIERERVERGDTVSEHYQSALGVIVSRNAGRRAVLYLQPIFIANSNPLEEGDNSTLLVGVGGRLRVRPATYVFAEFAPRAAGYDPGVDHISFGVEGRAGGHLFQINFSNSFATTFGQIGRGGHSNDDWYIGFNISRKFF